jgi:hypothetical protein
MPPNVNLDETYAPRPWRCDECRRVLGVVMRDKDRIRRLWVFSVDKDEAQLPTTADLRIAAKGLYKIHGMDMCRGPHQGVECSNCGALSEWSMSKESLDKIIERYTTKAAPTAVEVATVDGVK